MTLEQWDALSEDERGWWRSWAAAKDAEASEKCSCGLPREVCGDPERDWYPQRTVCYVQRETAAARAMYELRHKDQPFTDGEGSWAAERSAAHPYHFNDGVHIWVAPVDLNPEDRFL